MALLSNDEQKEGALYNKHSNKKNSLVAWQQGTTPLYHRAALRRADDIDDAQRPKMPPALRHSVRR